MSDEPLYRGKVEWLCTNGGSVEDLWFNLNGPTLDKHVGFARKLSGHDRAYIATSKLSKGSEVFNWRSWTGLSYEEYMEVEKELGRGIPRGCLLENVVISGIPHFSNLPPTSRLVFPQREGLQAILAVWSGNSPCVGVGRRFAEYYHDPELSKALIAAALGRRGVVGIVLSAGLVSIGDEVLVYPPVGERT